MIKINTKAIKPSNTALAVAEEFFVNSGLIANAPAHTLMAKGIKDNEDKNSAQIRLKTKPETTSGCYC